MEDRLPLFIVEMLLNLQKKKERKGRFFKLLLLNFKPKRKIEKKRREKVQKKKNFFFLHNTDVLHCPGELKQVLLIFKKGLKFRKVLVYGLHNHFLVV